MGDVSSLGIGSITTGSVSVEASAYSLMSSSMRMAGMLLDAICGRFPIFWMVSHETA